MFSNALKSFTSNISANYTVSPTPSSTSGAWKVYDAKKKSTGKAVSVFVFERKSLEPPSGGLGGRSGGSALRKLHDEVIARVKKESNALARLRHPSILELTEPIEETRSGGLMFATEPVTASLAGLLQEKDDQERRGGGVGRPSRFVVEEADGQQRRKELEIDELEIQKGLLQVAQGLDFLHESAGLVHGNLTPEAIYINAKSDWKIAGLGFAGPPDASNSQSTLAPISLSEVLYHDPRLPNSVQLNIDYTSPDFVLDSSVSASADMFSLGLSVLALYNSPHVSPLKTSQNLSTYKKIFSSSSSVPSSSNNFLCAKSLPKDLVSEVLPRLVTRRPGQRMNAREFQQSQFFDNILVSSVRFLDSLPAKTPLEKSQFMRGLPRILEQFPKSVLEKKVLPALLEETKDKELLFLILQNVFKIIKILPSGRRAFTEKVIPQLRETFLTSGGKASTGERDTAKEAGLVVVLENMPLVSENCSGGEFKKDILPILQLGLESPTHSIVDKSLGCLPTILATLDFSTIKNELFPVVAAVFSKTSSLGIKIRGLEAFVILCGGSSSDTTEISDGLDGGANDHKPPKQNTSAILDKYTVQEKVVPLLKAMKTKEPAVMMAALAVFKQVGKIADSEFLAMDVLPILWAFSLGPLLNLQQFQEFMKLIKSLSSKIEQEQTRKLRDLASNSNGIIDDPRSNDLMSMGPINGTGASGSDDVGENDFERLVLGKSPATTTNGTDMLGASLRPQPSRAHSSTSAVAPIFNWSTPSLTPTPALSTANAFSTTQPSSRAITPDQTLSSFAALKPSTTSTPNTTSNNPSAFAPMQPTQPTTALAWGFTQPIPAPSAFSNPLQPQHPSTFGIPTSPMGSQTQFSGFSIAPPPSGGQQGQGGYGGGSGRAGAGAGAGAGYGAGLGRGGSIGMGQRSSNQGQKKGGLDAFESLL